MASLELVPARQTSSAPAAVIALLILAAIAAAIFYFNPHKIVEFHVTSSDTYAPRTTFNALDAPSPNGMHVLGAPTTSTEENLYVIAHVTMTDKLRLPIFVDGAVARVTMSDGTVYEANILSGSDLKRLEVIFPDITQHAASPIFDGDEIAPGQTRTGTLVLPFPGQTAEAWHAKKNATLTITLRNQGPQTTGLP